MCPTRESCRAGGAELIAAGGERRELADALQRERDELERVRRLEESRGLFFNSVVHDLRTSVAVLAGYGTILEHKRDDLTSDERDFVVRRIRVTAQKLDRLLSALLDLNRTAEGGALDFLRTDIARLVTRTVEAAEAESHRVEVAGLEHVEVQAHVAMIERIVDNLIQNAVKYSPAGSLIRVKVERKDEGAVIEVADEGRGVPEHLKEVIFEPFHRGHEAARTYGSGVGLYLVSRFARIHGGRAWVEDRAGGGSVFKVYLPASPARHNGKGSASEAR